MSPNVIIGLVLVALIAVVGVWIIIGSKSKKWFKVYMANNDVKLLYRDFRERFWRTSDRYMRFKDEFDREITYPSGAHWILYMEEVLPHELDIVRDEIRRMRETKEE